MDPRECGVCGWIYDPLVGDDDAQVPPGVAFDELPVTYACPRCAASKLRFVRPPADFAERLVAAYRVIDRRMRELPIYNPQLAVEAVDFQPSGALLVGAMITPWFLNLVAAGPPLPRQGDTVELSLPGGRFAAMAASPEGVDHLAVPLVSPVLHLVDQPAARALAAESLRLARIAPKDAGGGDPKAASTTLGRRSLLGGLLGA